MCLLSTKRTYEAASAYKGRKVCVHNFASATNPGGGNEVVILGAFGCGAFENNPEVVASASKEVVSKYLDCFETIEFAIYCSSRYEQNYRIFKRVLGV